MRPGPDAGTCPDGRHEYLRTSCGRELAVGRLALGDARHPAARVFVGLGECSGCEGTGWAGLTVAEARQPARGALARGAAAARECQGPAAGGCWGCEGTGWAGLTVAEARQLARAVLAQPPAAERECQAHAAGTARRPVASS